MEMSKVRDFMRWYEVFFERFVQPVLESTGFTKDEAGFWGFNSFRRPVITVLEDVGSKSQNDTVTTFVMLLVPTVAVGIFTSFKWMTHFGAVVNLTAMYMMVYMMKTLFVNSFTKDRPFCEIGAALYEGNEKKFLKRYSDALVLLATREAGKVAKRFKRRANREEYVGFYSKLTEFNGFNDETQK